MSQFDMYEGSSKILILSTVKTIEAQKPTNPPRNKSHFKGREKIMALSLSAPLLFATIYLDPASFQATIAD